MGRIRTDDLLICSQPPYRLATTPYQHTSYDRFYQHAFERVRRAGAVGRSVALLHSGLEVRGRVVRVCHAPARLVHR